MADRGAPGSIVIGSAMGDLRQWSFTETSNPIDITSVGAAIPSLVFDINQWDLTIGYFFEHGDAAQNALKTLVGGGLMLVSVYPRGFAVGEVELVGNFWVVQNTVSSTAAGAIEGAGTLRSNGANWGTITL